MKSPKFPGSFGSQIIIAQQQQRHQKRLDEIYNKRPSLSSKTVNQQYLMMSLNRNPSKMSKKSFNEQMNHHLTIKHLIQRLNSPKSYKDRLKDVNDFIAYPALFFRYDQTNFGNSQNETKNKKVQRIKNKNQIPLASNQKSKNKQNMSKRNVSNDQPSQKVKNIKQKTKNKVQQGIDSQSVNSQLLYHGLTVQKVTSLLPQLYKFDQDDIEYFADHLTQIIFQYNLNTMEDIQFLFQCVEQYLPQHYPQNFVNAIQDMFKQIVNSLNKEE